MMSCWQCGAPLPPDVGFCRTCGAFVRPRSVPVNRPGLTTPVAPQTPAGSFPDVAAAPPLSSSAPGFELSPPFSTRSTPSSVGGAAAVSSVPGTAATPSTSWPAAPATAWLSPSSTARPGSASAGVATNSNVGDVFAGVGTGFVLISLLLTWYRVTITPLGVQFLESLERALFSRLFPQAAAGLGGLTGPLTLSLSALDRAAGGWRWADPGRVDRHSSGSSLGRQCGHDETVGSDLATHGHPPGDDGREPPPCCRGLCQSALWRDASWLPDSDSWPRRLPWACCRAHRMRRRIGGIGQGLSRRRAALTDRPAMTNVFAQRRGQETSGEGETTFEPGRLGPGQATDQGSSLRA